jgi:hypothetical protein
MPLHASTRNSKAAEKRRQQRKNRREGKVYLGHMWAKDIVIEALLKQARIAGLTREQAEAEIGDLKRVLALLSDVQVEWAKRFLGK